MVDALQHKKGQPAEDHPAVVELQKQLMTAVAETPEVQSLAEDAFRSFTRAYAAHPSSIKDVFHVRKLHLGHVAHSFALRWDLCDSKLYDSNVVTPRPIVQYLVSSNFWEISPTA